MITPTSQKPQTPSTPGTIQPDAGCPSCPEKGAPQTSTSTAIESPSAPKTHGGHQTQTPSAE